MNLKEIVEGRLQLLGCDGFVSADGDCHCARGDIMRCDSVSAVSVGGCEPAVLVSCPCCGETFLAPKKGARFE